MGQPQQGRGIAYRMGVAGRVLLAALGGYGLAALLTALLSVTLPLPRSEAVAAATLPSFAVMVAAAIFVFASRSLARAALGLGALCLLLGGGLWLVQGQA
ncbi:MULTISPECIES: iron transporter [Methylobacterium]|uniref:iron transporter n=1 Tax=Methylobacterium TaxID=407 RepID=UPI001044A654|nr:MULTISPECIES: iron transporter [Methylobacterium]MDR7039994.1 hypothetical protein [Methylobacterium sp. BE186]